MVVPEEQSPAPRRSIDPMPIVLIERGDIASCDGTSFALEALAERLSRGLDRDDPIEPCVTSLINFAHTTRTELHKDFERPEPGTRR